MVATLLSAFLGSAVLASAVTVVAARRPAYAGIALGANSLLLAIIGALLGAELVAVTWGLLGVGMVCAALVINKPLSRGMAPAPSASGKLVALGAGLLSTAMLLGGLIVQYAPGQVGAGILPAAPTDAEGGLALLSTDYAPGVIGIALIVVATLVGMRLRGDEP